MEFVLYVGLGVALSLVAAAVFCRFWGFRAQSPDDYAGQKPGFDIRERLNGPLACEGVIYGPTGRVVSRFVAEMNAVWDGDCGTMTEHFRYDNGTTQDREWTLVLNPDGTILADAPDLVGTGKGRQSGAGVMLNYRLRLSDAAGGHVLDTVDWMYLLDNGAIMNRSQMRKFGIKVAELVATMRPMSMVASDADADRLAAE